MFNDYAFIFYGPGTDSEEDRRVIERAGFKTTLVPVPEPHEAIDVAVELVEEGVQLLELCGAFGPVITAQIIEATEGRIPVGSVNYGSESVDALARLTESEA